MLVRGESRKQRVVIYGMNYAPEMAGVGRYTGEIGESLANSGHDVCVVTTPPHYPGWRAQHGYSGTRWTSETLAGVAVYRCPLYLHRDMKGVRRLLAPLTFAASSAPVALWQILRRRPDVVLAVEPTLFVAPLALLAAKLLGARTVLHVQDLEIDAAFAVGHLGKGGAAARLASWFERGVMRRFDRIITISNRMRGRIAAKSVPSERVFVLRNWVDVERIRPLAGRSSYRHELGLSDDDFVILYSGNIGAKQGIRLVIEAARLSADNPRLKFIVAGDGPMRPAVEEAARELPNLRLLPFQPEERFSEFLGLADLHVLPQERDAADLLLPSKLGGMLASGRRIVVTADAGTELAEFLGTSCTFVPPGDAAALAEVMADLAGRPACAAAQSQRLKLAESLSKASGIREFERLLLFDDGCPSQVSEQREEELAA